MRVVSTLLGLLLTFLLGVSLFGQGGYRDRAELARALEAEQAEVQALKRRNAALRAEVEDLRSGGAAIERIAREELGLVRPGETFIQVLEIGPDGESRAPDFSVKNADSASGPGASEVPGQPVTPSGSTTIGARSEPESGAARVSLPEPASHASKEEE